MSSRPEEGHRKSANRLPGCPLGCTQHHPQLLHVYAEWQRNLTCLEVTVTALKDRDSNCGSLRHFFFPFPFSFSISILRHFVVFLSFFLASYDRRVPPWVIS